MIIGRADPPTTPSGVAPAHPKCLALYLINTVVYSYNTEQKESSKMDENSNLINIMKFAAISTIYKTQQRCHYKNAIIMILARANIYAAL